MAYLHEPEPNQDDATAEFFGVRDWLEAALVDGMDDTVDGETARLARWYDAVTQTRYMLRRVELREVQGERARPYYYLQAYESTGYAFRGYLYSADMRLTMKCDNGRRMQRRDVASYQQAETELLAHLRTMPSHRWPHSSARLPDGVVDEFFARMYAETFGPKGLQYKTSWRLADMLRRLRRTMYGRRTPQ